MSKRPIAHESPAAGRDDAALRAAYAVDTGRTLRQRLTLTVALFLLLVGTAVILEHVYHPERAQVITLIYAAEAFSCLVALVLCQLTTRPAVVAAGLGAALSVLMTSYMAIVGGEVERIATAQVCLLSGLVVMMPWGWGPQLFVGAISFIGAFVVAPQLGVAGSSEQFSYAVLAIITGTTTSAAGASFLARYRWDVFARTHLLEQTSAVKAAILEAALDSIVTIDHEGRITEFNPAAEQMFGRAREAVLGRDMADVIIPPELRAQHRQGLVRYLTTGEAAMLGRRIETTALCADGRTVPVELTITRIRRDGPPTFTGNLRDITERKRAEEALTRSKQQAEEEAEIAAALLHVGETLNVHLNQPDMLERVTRLAVEALGCDWGTTFVWNERRAAYGVAAAYGVRREVLDEVSQIEFTLDSMPIVRAHRPGALVEIADYREQSLVQPALLARWQVASELCAPIPRRDDVIGILCLGYRERTGPFSARQRRLATGIAHATAIALENARLITDLQAANALKSEFVSTMSHELRTPLNVILGFVEMAQDVDVPPPERERCLARIDTAGRELLDLIESTLQIGKIEAGRDDLQLEAIALPPFWRALGASCLAIPRKAGVALEWGADVPDVSLTSDPRKLGIVVRNLVGNACKFTEQGFVRATVQVTADSVTIAVADSGIGIRPEDQDLVFQMFRQADGSDSRRFGGTGLGLYIVRRFVQQLGGTVGLASAAGRGSTFTIVIPRTPLAPPLRRAA